MRSSDLTRRSALLGLLMAPAVAEAQRLVFRPPSYRAGFQFLGAAAPVGPLTVLSTNRSNALTVAADNLTVTGNDTQNAWCAVATTNTRAVACYFEVTITGTSSGSNYHGVLLGLAGPGTVMPNAGLPTGFQGDGSYSATGHQGVTLGCYIVPASADGANDGTITSYYAGTAQTPVKHSFKTFQPLTGLYSADTLKCNFGQSTFVYTPPSGAVPA